MSTTAHDSYEQSRRPAIALITNHGYAGVRIPIGGAPDTGGQNLYVNSLALALDQLGYKITIFARGGFPHFDEDRMRSGAELLSDFVRYVFVPGGGKAFIHKEDIAEVLDEQIDWIEAFIQTEAEHVGCEPWRVYEFVNTHYWDAAVIGVRLIERWRNDIAARDLGVVLASAVPAEAIARMIDERHWLAVGEAPGYTLGRLLLSAGPTTDVPLMDRVRTAASRWISIHGGGREAESYLIETVERVIQQTGSIFPPDLLPILAANTLGPAALAQCPDIDARLSADLEFVNTHVWTPHSLGDLKDSNFRNRTSEARRGLKFCERRNHERMICSRTRAFASTSTEMAEQLWTHYRVPIIQTFYFPPCLDLTRFRTYTEDELRATYDYLVSNTGVSLDVLQRAPIIFETSRMDHTKRKDVLIAAFTRVVTRHPDAFLLIGGGPDNDVTQFLREQIERVETLRGHAFLLGPIPDEHIGPLFSLADIYATTSEMEGFGMSASQAAASRTSLVSSNLVPFAVNHVPDDAIICPAGDVDAFACAIISLLDDPADRDRRAERLAACVEQFDWINAARRFMDHLRGHCFRIRKGQPA